MSTLSGIKNQSLLQSKIKWHPPNHDCLKINVDTTFKPSGAYIGVIVRNFKGTPLLIWVVKTKASSAMEVELMAVRHKISLAKIKGWQRAIVEGDCKPIMEVLHEGKSNPDW